MGATGAPGQGRQITNREPQTRRPYHELTPFRQSPVVAPPNVTNKGVWACSDQRMPFNRVLQHHHFMHGTSSFCIGNRTDLVGVGVFKEFPSRWYTHLCIKTQIFCVYRGKGHSWCCVIYCAGLDQKLGCKDCLILCSPAKYIQLWTVLKQAFVHLRFPPER